MFYNDTLELLKSIVYTDSGHMEGRLNTGGSPLEPHDGDFDPTLCSSLLFHSSQYWHYLYWCMAGCFENVHYYKTLFLDLVLKLQ